MAGRLGVVCLLVLALAGCGGLGDRVANADGVAGTGGMRKTTVKTKAFVLTAYTRLAAQGKADAMTVYIEGDGLAWMSRTQLSSNPTPRNPTALQLAVLDASPNVVYLARPCQYTDPDVDAKCQSEYWSSKRFAEEVIASTDQAIDHFKTRTGAGTVYLVGYSGGGAVAALVAGRRKDIGGLRTVAGNLDHVALHRHHKVDQLVGSLNAVDVARNLKGLPQRHYSGTDDETVPAFIADAFAKAVNDPRCVRTSRIKGADHRSGWDAVWPSLLRQPMTCDPG